MRPTYIILGVSAYVLGLSGNLQADPPETPAPVVTHAKAKKSHKKPKKHPKDDAINISNDDLPPGHQYYYGPDTTPAVPTPPSNIAPAPPGAVTPPPTPPPNTPPPANTPPAPPANNPPMPSGYGTPGGNTSK